MVEIHAVYEGNLHCRLTHGPSGETLVTDAPKDNQGEGKAFSPTDLVAVALGSCILTVMGIVAKRHRLDLIGTKVVVRKEMVNEPHRRIARLPALVTFPRSFSERERALLEGTAMRCPVHHSLHPDIEAPVEFVYPS